MKENSPSIRMKEELSGLPTGSVYLNLCESSPLPLFPICHRNDTETWLMRGKKKSPRTTALDILSLSLSA